MNRLLFTNIDPKFGFTKMLILSRKAMTCWLAKVFGVFLLMSEAHPCDELSDLEYLCSLADLDYEGVFSFSDLDETDSDQRIAEDGLDHDEPPFDVWGYIQDNPSPLETARKKLIDDPEYKNLLSLIPKGVSRDDIQIAKAYFRGILLDQYDDANVDIIRFLYLVKTDPALLRKLMLLDKRYQLALTGELVISVYKIIGPYNRLEQFKESQKRRKALEKDHECQHVVTLAEHFLERYEADPKDTVYFAIKLYLNSKMAYLPIYEFSRLRSELEIIKTAKTADNSILGLGIRSIGGQNWRSPYDFNL